MKRILISFIIMSFISQTSWSQYTPDSTWKFDIHVNPLALAYYPHQRIQLGFEYHQMHRITYGVELGYGDASLFGSTYSDEYISYDIRPTIKIYGGSNTQVTRIYLGLESFFSFQEKISTNGYYYSLDLPLMVRYDKADMDTWRAGLNLIAGIKIVSVTHITIDLFGGVGYGLSHVSYSNMIDLESSSIFPRNLWFNNANQFPGTEFFPSITGGIKFGFYIDGKK